MVQLESGRDHIIFFLLMNQIEIYRTSDNQTSVEVRFAGETVWLTMDEMATLFLKSRATLNEHILTFLRRKNLINKRL